MRAPLALLLLIPLTAARAAEWFVAPTGLDAPGRGTFAAPYQTIDYAADCAEPGDIITIRGGTYRETLTPARSGTAAQPIVFRPYENETVVLTGLDLIIPGANGAGQWQSDGGEAYRIQLNANYGSDSGWDRDRLAGNQVWLNGQPLAKARWPNAPTPLGLRRSQAATAASGFRTRIGTSSEFAAGYRASSLATFATDAWRDGIITYAAGSGWYRRTSAITGNTPNGASSEVRFTYDPYNEAANRENPNVGDPFFLMGRRVALDARGEYFFDTLGSGSQGRDGPRHTLYLIAPDGASPAGRVVEMRRRRFALDLTGVSHLRFENLQIRAGRIRTSNTTSHLTFQGLALEYGAYSWHEELGEAYENFVLRGNQHRVLDSLVRFSTANGILVASGQGHEIRNTVVHDHLLGGIELRPASGNVLVENCTVFHLGGTGIGADARPSRVFRNHGAHNGLFSTDVGLLNAGTDIGDSLGSEWAFNWMHSALGAKDESRHWYGTPGIRLDAGFEGDGPSNYLIHHNVVWNTTQPEKAVALWALRGGTSPQTNYGDAKIRVYNNTVDTRIGVTETFNAPASAKGIDLRNNLTGAGFNLDSTTVAVSSGRLYWNDLVLLHNLFPSRTIANNPTPPHLNNLNTSPGWLDSSASARPFGFQLSSTSAARQAGIAIPGITDHHPGSAPDIGALPFGLPPFVPGAKLRPRDLAALQVTPTPVGDRIAFVVSGLPVGRSLPDTFHLRIGNAAPSTAFAHHFDFTTLETLATVTAPSTPGPDQLVRFSLDGGATWTTSPATITVDSDDTAPVPPGTVRETFAYGLGSAFPQQFPGTAGAGWSGPWAASSLVSATVNKLAPLQPSTGNALRVTRTGGSGSAAQEGVSRPWSATTLDPAQFLRLRFDLRLDSSTAVFNDAGDNLTVTLNNIPGAAGGTHSTIYLRAFGAASGPLATREWGVFHGTPGTADAYALQRFIPTGVFAQPGLTTSFQIDIFAAPAHGATGGRTHATYNVTLTDGSTTRTILGAGFRSEASSAGGHFAVSTQQNLTTDNLAFSLDSIELTALPALPPLQAWRIAAFGEPALANPALESTLWGPLADPDRDGLPNLLEYALALDPNSFSHNAFQSNVRNTNIGPVLELTFFRARSDLSYIVEATSDLAEEWQAIATDPGQVGEWVTVTDEPEDNPPRRFLRLRVQ
jgi:hypothetical protein